MAMMSNQIKLVHTHLACCIKLLRKKIEKTISRGIFVSRGYEAGEEHVSLPRKIMEYSLVLLLN